MATKTCYYETLGVERDADGDAIKRAYRKMAMKYHPDRNPDDPKAEEAFKECSEAYGILSDPNQRSAYDRFGHDGISNNGGMQHGSFEDIFGHFNDILGDIFGGGGGRRARRRGADLRVDLEVPFEEAVTGTRRDVTFERHDVCGTCEGSGAKAGTKPETCTGCQGRGKITRQQGFFMVQTTCPVCRGAGSMVKDKCGDCRGDGATLVERTISVKIPPGVDSGMRLRVSGEGETGGVGVERGDLSIMIHVQQHPSFQRDGADVHAEQVLTFSQAALGSEHEVETIHGPEEIGIPAGTQTGTVLRLRGRGFERIDGRGKGDHFITLRVEVPTGLSSEQKELLEQLKAAGL